MYGAGILTTGEKRAGRITPKNTHKNGRPTDYLCGLTVTSPQWKEVHRGFWNVEDAKQKIGM